MHHIYADTELLSARLLTRIILRPLSALSLDEVNINRNYSAILATLQITSYALGVYIALLFTCQLH